MELKIKAVSPKIGKEIPTPFYATPGSAAMDLHACLDQPITLLPGGRTVIPTGIAIALPSADYVALVLARSGLGIKHGVVPSNCVGSLTAITGVKLWWASITPGSRSTPSSPPTASPS